MTNTPDPQAIVAASMGNDSVVKEWMFRPEVFERLSHIAVSALADLAGDEIAEMLKLHAKAYGDYHKARDRWFDNGRYSEGVPRLDGLKAELDAYETTLKAIIASIQARGPVVTDEFQREVSEWQNRTFPNATKHTVVAHFAEESMELQTAVANRWDQVQNGSAHIEEEAADCFLLLIGLANRCGFSLMDVVRRKFEQNQTRTWGTVTAEGYTKHTNEAALTTEVDAHGHG